MQGNGIGVDVDGGDLDQLGVDVDPVEKVLLRPADECWDRIERPEAWNPEARDQCCPVAGARSCGSISESGLGPLNQTKRRYNRVSLHICLHAGTCKHTVL